MAPNRPTATLDTATHPKVFSGACPNYSRVRLCNTREIKHSRVWLRLAQEIVIPVLFNIESHMYFYRALPLLVRMLFRKKNKLHFFYRVQLGPVIGFL